ncbi:hypothetical protein N789_11300 [Arenimonas oryziterrae DSM 21050 = YC6267]|uniref:Dephospho-CoA kinase n=2 Tax=Arenimonas TaxID=490567 RepID=A0A091AUL6_9GAMM|nr:hypothetical protein N789_11300 [Arenimonas oryziterrae DSM 21050 = YC6267]
MDRTALTMATFVVAITGGVASGKSELARRFADLGIAIADADVVARQIVAPGQEALALIAERFGAGILREDGALDRGQLRERIFADPAARRDLETITHPRIRRELMSQCAAATGVYAMVAIPLLTEAGGRTGYPWLQRILVVDAPEQVQRARLMARDQASRELAERMIRAQADRQQRLALADDVVINDAATAALDAPVARLDALYRRLAAARGG